MKKLFSAVLFTIIATTLNAQDAQDMVAAYSGKAEEAYRAGNYDRALEHIALAERTMGKSNATLLYLKVKASVARFKSNPVPGDTVLISEGFRQFFTVVNKQKDPQKRYPELLALKLDFQDWLRDSLAHRMAGVVKVDGGSFLMGSKDGGSSDGEHSDEMPVHTVKLGAFYIGRYEVTVEQFWKFIQATGYKTTAELKGWSYIWAGNAWKKVKGVTWEHDITGARRTSREWDHPVVHVSWYDAARYCMWMSEQSGRQYRLPTEAEWEYAARGGGKNVSAYSDTSIDAVAWYKDNAGGTTHPVGSMMPNAFGLYDMQGNVWEWCSDWYNSDYYQESPSENPSGPAAGSFRVLRGGSWGSGGSLCRVSARGLRPPDNRNSLTGFRVAVSSVESAAPVVVAESAESGKKTGRKKKISRRERKNEMEPL